MGKRSVSLPFLFHFLMSIPFPFLGNWFGLIASRMFPRCFPIASRI